MGGKFKPALDIAQFIERAASRTEVKQTVIKHAFGDFSFSQALAQNLQRRKYIQPTPIQDQAIPYILEGKDLIGLAATGTGKTGAFLLPLIDKIYKDRSQRVLVIAPTRELAEQIDSEFRMFSYGMNIFSALCIGGVPIGRQLRALSMNPHVVIGTPGRLQDMAERKAVAFSSFNNVVVDEIDRMLDMGFIKPISDILKSLNQKRQSLFFSATIPDTIKKLARQFLKDFVMVEIQSGVTVQNITQDVIRVSGRSMKFDKLKEILARREAEKVLIFNETKRGVDTLTYDLRASGFRVLCIHGDKHQRERQRFLTQFRENKAQILVATDVASRGLDIKDVTHVINYTMPETYDDYIHRIGRTGRSGAKGAAVTFVG
ncbi:MAG: DEAD/DEAH box helicase [Candidatus Jacksonbacteria bacterium]|nr:DEAD/DEAH box helicase [Candidatus Jacksonbacteria bacterium]